MPGRKPRLTTGTPTEPATGRQPQASSRSLARRLRLDGWAPWVLIGPTMLVIAIFFVWPIAQTLYFSFTKWGAFGGQQWVGLENYQRLFSDPALGRAIFNTLLYTAVALLAIPLATWLAALLNRPTLRFRSLFRTLFLLPVVTVPSAIAMVWKLLLNGEIGLINVSLAALGIEGPYWLQTPVLVTIVIALVGIWASLGFSMVILGAGLQAIPREVYEAAEIDGASRGQQFRSITVPLLTPSIFFVTVMSVISSFKVFDLIYLMVGPTNPVISESQTLVYLIFDRGFRVNDKGYAAAAGFVLLILISAVTLVQFRLQRKWVHYA